MYTLKLLEAGKNPQDVKTQGVRFYLAGPMRGIPNFNFPEFRTAAKLLRKKGHVVFNPAERDIDRFGKNIIKKNPTGSEEQARLACGFDLRDALLADLEFICRYADAIAMLPGWEHSSGVAAELATARALGLMIFELEKNNGNSY